MSQARSVNFALLSMAIDAICVSIALGIVTFFRPWMSNLPYIKEIPAPLATPWLLYPLFSVIWVLTLLLLAVYDPARQARRLDEITQLTVGSILAAMALAGLLYFSFRDVSRALFFVFTGLAFSFMLAWRFAARSLLPAGKALSATSRKVLIIGYSEAGKELYQETQDKPELGLQVVGFVDDHPNHDSRLILGTLQNIGLLIDNIKLMMWLSPLQISNTSHFASSMQIYRQQWLTSG